MSLVKAKKLRKSYGLLNVLSDATFTLERGQKVALVGNNGTGKTTLLKLIAGLEEPDSGSLGLARNTAIGYLPQDIGVTGNETVVAYLRQLTETTLPPKDFNHRVQVMFAGFGLEKVGLEDNLANLSSGQKSKVALTGILLKGVDLLLLDEPTNNLDLPALIWLEDFLQKTEAACLVVSHDRRFLDQVAQKIFELDWHSHTLTINGGKYSDYVAMMAKRFNRQKENYRLQEEEIERLTKSSDNKNAEAERGAMWTGSDNDKFLRGHNRDRSSKSSRVAKTLRKKIEQIEKIEKPPEKEALEIALTADPGAGTLDSRLFDLVAGYPEGFKIGPLDLELRYGERIGLMGLNGSGKSTLLKTITGELTPLAGRLEIGAGVRIGNMMQEHETLPRERSVIQFMLERAGLDQPNSYSKLIKFGFEEKQIKLPISNLSPGGRARLLLALFSAQSVNMLVLDEPTNHLDLEALGALEETLKTYEGTVLLVSHDRYFLEKAVLDATYVLADGTITKIADYKDYVKAAEEKARKLLRLL